MKKIILLPLLALPILGSCGSHIPQAEKEYTITFINDDGEVLQQSKVVEGKLPVYEGDTPTKDAPDENHQNVYVGWDKEIVKAEEDATYKATYDYVFLFGSYPQTLVTDLDLINQLDDISAGDYGYKTLDGKQYFQYDSEQNYVAEDGTKVDIDVQNQPYKYYEVKPIQWKILLDEVEGSPKFYTTYKLLVQQIYNTIPETNDGYTNVYQNSYINTWLNDIQAPAQTTDIGGFSWRAFSSEELSKITNSEIVNDVASTCDKENIFASDPFNTKVFELSRLNLHGKGDSNHPDEEYKFYNEDSIDESKMAKTTDFARATGAGIGFNNYGLYWTRSPADNDWCFKDPYYAYVSLSDGYIVQHQIDDNHYCARPAIRFE